MTISTKWQVANQCKAYTRYPKQFHHIFRIVILNLTYHGDHATGTNAVTHAHSHQSLVVRVLSPSCQHLVAHVVGTLVDHEAAALYPAGVAAAQVGGQLSAVTAGLIGTTLEIPVLIEDDLKVKV